MAGELENERDWISRSRAGDVGAFNRLVEAYEDRVYGLCLRMMGSREAAEDAAQDAFIAAFRGIGRLRGEAFRTWMFRIASNTCLDALRKRGRGREIHFEGSADDEFSAFEPVDREPGPDERLLQAQLRSDIEAALLAIPADQRLAVVLCDIEGMEYAEIAASMGCSIGTVKSRISRGRSRLRQLLGNTLGETETTLKDKE